MTEAPHVRHGRDGVSGSLCRSQEAFERYDQAVSLDANYIDARFNKATVLLDAGDYARAKTELTAIVEKKQDDFVGEVMAQVKATTKSDPPATKH